MTKKEKQLLLQDLCARLPYDVNVHDDMGRTYKLQLGNSYLIDLFYENGDYVEAPIRPYLRPMSSMTEEEITEIYEFARPYIIEEIKHGAESDNPDRKVEIENGFLSNAVIVDELNKRHFDYRGLIPMGLALPAEEGMYKNI